MQIVSLFSVIAVLPAVLVSIVANVTLDRGLDRLFSGPTREVIGNSLVIASAYLHEHGQLIGGDIVGGAQSFSQLLTRPVASLNPYATSDPAIFICSASTPPGGGVHGMCGLHAANAALRHLERRA